MFVFMLDTTGVKVAKNSLIIHSIESTAVATVSRGVSAGIQHNDEVEGLTETP